MSLVVHTEWSAVHGSLITWSWNKKKQKGLWTKGIAYTKVQRNKRAHKFKWYKHFIVTGMELIIQGAAGFKTGGSVHLLNDSNVGNWA